MGRQVCHASSIYCAQAAFLHLRKADVPVGAGLVSIGPDACLSGRLQLVKGQLGMSSQVRVKPASLEQSEKVPVESGPHRRTCQCSWAHS